MSENDNRHATLQEFNSLQQRVQELAVEHATHKAEVAGRLLTLDKHMGTISEILFDSVKPGIERIVGHVNTICLLFKGFCALIAVIGGCVGIYAALKATGGL